MGQEGVIGGGGRVSGVPTELARAVDGFAGAGFHAAVAGCLDRQ